MSKIRILPEQLANQIAAGEVVERPASVVKELLENSLDAGATRIEIEIDGGGTGLIRIIDNGEGMDEDDVLLSLERHGTSKITSDEDLAAISTLGFRGEAIPSIGSVSKMAITSRRAGSELGTRAEVHFGRLVRVHEAGCGIGTMFEVRNLFGNTPARKKFLRTVRTELSHIEEVIRNYALARPEITFSLSVGGKRTLYLDNTFSLEQRLAAVMNHPGSFIRIGDREAATPERRIYGFLVPPEQSPMGPARLRLMVNGRAVRDRMIGHGATEGLRSFLMKGKNPAGLIHLILPPDEVDVNVHPAKQEVRFRNSREVHFLIVSVIQAAMLEEQKRLQTAIFGPSRQQPATVIPLDRDLPAEQSLPPDVELPPVAHTAPAAPVAQPAPASPDRQVHAVASRAQDTTITRRSPTPVSRPLSVIATTDDRRQQALKTCEPVPRRPEPGPIVAPSVASTPSRPGSLLPSQPAGHGLQIIGQFADLYIFCRNQEGQLLVIDQHAAHERLLFEELRRQYLGRSVARQNLLFPESVELTLFQTRLLEQHGEELEHMGFSIREFGGNTFIISAVPALASRLNPHELLIEVLEQFGSEGSRRDGDSMEAILATMACKAAVKAGTALSPREIDALLNRMAGADLFSHCPHGRPVVKLFSQSEIQKWFART